MTVEKTLIFIPTYNEAKNVRVIFAQIMALNLGTDMLLLDDNSPDGTGQIIDEIAAENKGVYTIHRSGKLGIGSAHRDGIRWAYEHGYKTLITMDCDFSHSPEYLKDFIRYAEGVDIVVGSRYMDKDSIKGWNMYRKVLTYVGHFLTKTLLKMPYDATGAFRLYRLNRIPQGVFDLVESQGYSFFFDSLYILHMNRYSIQEFSIHLPTRTYGESKMTLNGALNSFTHLVRIYFTTLTHKERFTYAKTFVPRNAFMPASKPYTADGKSAAEVQAEWDVYWNKERKSTNIVYDLIAEFYRVFIIRRILNHFIKKHFTYDSSVLHAGCGSGQVDSGVAKWVKITAMDISAGALNLYKRSNPTVSDIVQGDIFNPPFPDRFFDGIYNLGVMEHFTEEEIQKILGEFDRILKPGGKMVVLVPPENGLSVIFLKGVHFVLNKILRKNVQLHPAEISRPRSEDHARRIYEQHGLTMVDFYFGPMDVFTYAVVVLQKSPALAQAAAVKERSHSIVVTGATGFIGRRLIKKLVDQYGRDEIVCLVRHQVDSYKEKSGRENLKRLGVAVCEGDLLTGLGLEDLPKSPRLVFHLASCTDTSQTDHSINDVGTKHFLEAIAPLDASTHIVFTSSIAVNDGRRDYSKPMTESTPVERPYHIYGRKKLRAEQYLTAQSKIMGFRLSIIRVCGVFGPDSIEKGLYTSVKKMVTGGETTLHRMNWPGRVSSMYVEDMAHFIAEVARHKPAGGPELYIPSVEALTISDMSRAFYEAYELEYDPIHVPGFVWKTLEFVTGRKRFWETVLPHVLYNKVWQANILVSQGYWNESEKMQNILGKYRTTTFKEFCMKLAQQEREYKLHEILRRDHSVHPS
jgi:dolichol-phosphate mannosyltransferase